MSNEQFLARWSRRKQEAKAGCAEPAPEAAEANEPPPDGAGSEPVPQETNLSDLPPIESIDAATDIWSTDPAIRDFVGLAENAWDFNDPNAMPGFGPLDYSVEQVDALVRRIVGDMVQVAESLPIPPVETVESALQSATAEVGSGEASDQTIGDPRSMGESAPTELLSSAAAQPLAANKEAPLPRRTHGGALPR
jgi:Protein of unknown function (DUF3306)